MELFSYEPQLKFEQAKVATAQLDDDPSTWTKQVLTELFRTIPESSEYVPQVMFTATDKEQGYALGCIVISADTDTALSTARPAGSATQVFIPIVVRGHVLAPLDILMTSKGRLYPLTASRLREALFRPEMFDLITEDWGDTSLYNFFYPPGRSDNMFGAGMSQGIGGGSAGAVTYIQGPGVKMSSAPFELLEQLLPTLRASDVSRVAGIIDSEEGLLKAASANATFLQALSLISKAENNKIASGSLMNAALDLAPTDVVQLGYSHSQEAYWVKCASRSAYKEPEHIFMSRGDFLKFAGMEVTKKVDTDGTVTVSSNKTAAEVDESGSDWQIVTEPGIYKVQTTAGKEMTGWVIPNLLDAGGGRVPMVIFTNGAAAAIQDQIAGAHVATGVDLPSKAPKGTGAFYWSAGSGVAATVPLLVVGSELESSNVKSYHVQTLTGESATVKLIPGLAGATAVNGAFMLPDSAKFLPLDTEAPVPLLSSPSELSKTASYLTRSAVVLYGGDGSDFGMRFENMPKLASAFGNWQDYDHAVMILCLAGLDANHAHQKLASASNGNTLRVTGLNDIRLGSDLAAEARKVASVEAHRFTDLRRYLTKEAAVLPDVMTIDAVLSLGFINPENVRMFIGRLPYLEKALNMVGELLLGSRLGLTEIPETAASRALRGLDDVIQGLRALSLRTVEEDNAAVSA